MAACVEALATRSGSSWYRSMILRIPLPGWVRELSFLENQNEIFCFSGIQVKLTFVYWVFRHYQHY